MNIPVPLPGVSFADQGGRGDKVMTFSSSSGLAERTIHCPYCGETIDILIDLSVPQQDYIEDCHVCCRPINFGIAVDSEGDAYVSVRSDNE